MPNIDNEGFKTIYRPPYSIEASACGVKCGVKMLNKYYDTRKDGEIVNVVALTEPYNIIGSHAFDFCHVKELTIPDTVTQLKRFAFADCKTLKKSRSEKVLKNVVRT
ncbi:leucine-rich repeat domain-containing protein [Blautia obeum]|uniref:leucine-rich repeat protein n=1 Tax=Blautia obeum TaxID=40520 RepID=UPI00210F089E|nr:leucine-rich repeat protein [Blautia obeum]MCQ4791017.1 leucine-rich repeat domain-containing protein [Blautia obeum]